MVTDLTCLARPCWSIDANTHSSDRQAADGRQSDLTLSIAAEKSADPAKAPVEVIITSSIWPPPCRITRPALTRRAEPSRQQ